MQPTANPKRAIPVQPTANNRLNIPTNDLLNIHFDFYYYLVYGIGPQSHNTEGLGCSKVFSTFIIAMHGRNVLPQMVKISLVSLNIFVVISHRRLAVVLGQIFKPSLVYQPSRDKLRYNPS